ncbi:MAG: Toxin RTX-I translocation ATP-binding protein [Chlamydiia bacterium]|nr:Toxin RTX-I translocation ATP-binding protein [Chlamydiia bacterium]
MEDLDFLKTATFPYKREKVPTVMQMEFVECGAASLSMVLSYYKRFCTLEELRVATGVSSDGVKANNILVAARDYGLIAKAFKKSIPNLVNLKPPFIVFWNFNHFLVVEGFCKKGVHLNDPANGPRLVTFKEFCGSYTGIALTFKKGEDFKPGGKEPSVFGALFKRIKGLKSVFLFLGITQACMLIPTLAVVAFTQIFIDDVFMNKYLDWKWYLIISMAIALLLHAFLIWMRGKCLYRTNAKIAIKLSSQFFYHLLKLPLNFYQQRSSGDLSYRLQLNDTVINIITGQLSRACLNSVLIIVYGVIMFYFSFWIGLIAVIEAGVNVALLLFINRSRVDKMGKYMQSQLKMMGYSVGGLQNIETIKSLGMEQDFFSKWANANTDWLVSTQEFGRVNVFLGTLTPFFKSLTSAATLGVGAYLVIKGNLSIGMLMALKIITAHFVGPLLEFVSLGQSLQKTKIDLLRLDDTLNNPQDPHYTERVDCDTIDEDHSGKLDGSLKVENLSFGYSTVTGECLKDLSFELKPGGTLGVVGPTDAGKTTLAQLLVGLYSPNSGTILYDGKEKKDIPISVFQNSISLADQTVNLFMGTVRDNITMWNTSVRTVTLLDAAKDAMIHDSIIERQESYEYTMKEQGTDFSGGERQRLEIARALATNPSLIILDEALSALDAETEMEVFHRLRGRGCSCLVISNRLSTIRKCDEILVIDRGEIVQRGSHDSLVKEDGFYKEVIVEGGKFQ